MDLLTSRLDEKGVEKMERIEEIKQRLERNKKWQTLIESGYVPSVVGEYKHDDVEWLIEQAEKGGKRMLELVVSGNIYRNNKTKNLYYVLAIGNHTETQEEMVIYRRHDSDDNSLCIRPLELFKEKFE
jgi:hypothetical protein